MACVANRSTTVRNAVSPMTNDRSSSPEGARSLVRHDVKFGAAHHDRSSLMAHRWNGGAPPTCHGWRPALEPWHAIGEPTSCARPSCSRRETNPPRSAPRWSFRCSATSATCRSFPALRHPPCARSAPRNCSHTRPLRQTRRRSSPADCRGCAMGRCAPGFISSWRRRNRRPFTAAGSFARSVDARTTSVTSFGSVGAGSSDPVHPRLSCRQGIRPRRDVVATDIVPAIILSARHASKSKDPDCC